MTIYLLWYDEKDALGQVYGGAFSSPTAAMRKARPLPGTVWEYDGEGWYTDNCWVEPTEIEGEGDD